MVDYTYSLDGSNNATITSYTGAGGAVSIPSTIDGYPVVAIGWGAFYERSTITSISIPNSVITVGDASFYHCINLTSVTFGSGVTYIGDGAFAYCNVLNNVTIPNNVVTLRGHAFYG